LVNNHGNRYHTIAVVNQTTTVVCDTFYYSSTTVVVALILFTTVEYKRGKAQFHKNRTIKQIEEYSNYFQKHI